MNVAAFASGRGSNLASILGHIDDGSLRSVRVVLVISNNSNSGALALARSRGIPALHISTRTHHSPAELCCAMLDALEGQRTDLLILAGYMKKLPPKVVAKFAGQILNIHPALLPRHGGRGMYGLAVHQAVIDAGEKETGVTIHYVDEEYDHGPIARQQRVPVDPDDTAQSLAARVLEVEHDLYWRVIGELSEKAKRSLD